jgi:hypothetical protein
MIMLGFIMSKMQMLLFAVGIAVVALLFYDFIARVGLAQSANTLLVTTSKKVSDQLNDDLLCSIKQATIPDQLRVGINNTPFYYDLEFSKDTFGTEDSKQNILVMRIVEHTKSTSPDKRNIIAAKSISTDSEFVLVDPLFLKELSGMANSYDMPAISLYPRAASKSEVQASSPNAFVALKEVVNGKKKIYIIPCATEKEPNNCMRNVLRVGCFKLATAASLTDRTLIDSCFNVSTVADSSIDKTLNYTWADCKTLFPEITG